MAPLIGGHDRLSARDDFGWRLVEPLDQRLYVDAGHESELPLSGEIVADVVVAICGIIPQAPVKRKRLI